MVITGYGLIAPGIRNKQQYKRALERGLCAQEVMPGMGPNGIDIICGRIHDEPISDRRYRHYPRVAHLAIAASEEAAQMAGIHGADKFQTTVIMGTSVGGLIEMEAYAHLTASKQYRRFPIAMAGSGNPHSLSVAVAQHMGLKGQAFTLSTGCTAGVDAMLMAKMMLESGQADICVAGGSDAPITLGSIYSFMRLGAMSRSSQVERAGMPFSSESDGFVMSEASGIVVMELESHALRRGAAIYGILAGIHSNNDGLSIFESDATGRNMTEAMQRAVGSVSPTYVNSQALGMKINDRVEAITHRHLFGSSIPITSIKGNIGHSFASIGNLQVISSLLSMEYSFIPATIKTDAKGFDDLPIVMKTRYEAVEHVAVSTHGYGGNNTCLLLSKYREAG
ncbi:beta-ketoacyl-[acyl-carrier-protein] synthase family protein [Paenibacillus senegalensis]|uniref:beta-ketoacyl-[acyl-carrier-protein] synthase family protein n=1 Tax=Paenibacillus senegalensis TaxID=1465766 RepID=UPI001F1CB665|nr:beta-ketoacyl synthase N-terminal-like domain-containing protein [Paenibacillus senegalensis]